MTTRDAPAARTLRATLLLWLIPAQVLILVGALGFVAFVPNSPTDQFTVIPFQIYNWVSRPQPDFHSAAAAASIVLLIMLLTMNAAAILLRNRYSRKL